MRADARYCVKHRASARHSEPRWLEAPKALDGWLDPGQHLDLVLVLADTVVERHPRSGLMTLVKVLANALREVRKEAPAVWRKLEVDKRRRFDRAVREMRPEGYHKPEPKEAEAQADMREDYAEAFVNDIKYALFSQMTWNFEADDVYDYFRAMYEGPGDFRLVIQDDVAEGYADRGDGWELIGVVNLDRVDFRGRRPA
jgi:hypothetical protein